MSRVRRNIITRGGFWLDRNKGHDARATIERRGKEKTISPKAPKKRSKAMSAPGVHGFWDKPLPDLLELLQATPAGLTSDEAKRRLRLYGPNSMVRESRFAGSDQFSPLLGQSPRHHPSRGQRHIARAG